MSDPTGLHRPRSEQSGGPSPSVLLPPFPSEPGASHSSHIPTNVTSPPNRLRGGGKPRHQPRRNHPIATRRSTRSSRASPLTDLDKLKLEDAAVKREMSRLGLSLRDVEGDGNCLFRALSDQLYGEQNRHPEIRKLTCDYLETHKQDMEFWVLYSSCLEGEDYAAYVTRMRKSGQYASEVEVNAAARMLRRDIRIVHSDHSETIPWETAAPPPQSPLDPEDHLSSTPRRRTRSHTTSLLSTPAAPPPSSPLYATALAEYLPPTRLGRTMLWLALFNNAEHYQSVRRKGDHERGPAEIDDKLAIPHEADQSEAAKIARGEVPPALTKAIKNAQGHSALVAQVLVSLPPHHGHSPEYVAGILARVKGNVGEAVEILLEEIVSDDEHERNSDQHVEAMLVDSEESRRHRSESPAPALSAATTIRAPSASYRDPPSRSKSSSPSAPNEPTSPSGSTTTTQSDSSRISKITTPSTTSSASASGSRSGERKPYDRPRKEELAEELDELRVNAGTGSASRGGTDAPARRRGRPRKDDADARRDALRQLRESRQRRQSKT
ncbi:hypothetical protein EHS25_008401 [Saitozyma podzolica]|uniref:OTU domain-containing protein n=1 Tax=Saitozyma podzolica TaxID=1890683 RepID=A0A427YPD2_9TREE|nr:hypothetical protein EHS25_008401 [Saitozyma podzolica]